MDRLGDLRELLDDLEKDFNKFYNKSNKAAGTRIRKGMQDLKRLAQEIRVEIQAKKQTD